MRARVIFVQFDTEILIRHYDVGKLSEKTPNLLSYFMYLRLFFKLYRLDQSITELLYQAVSCLDLNHVVSKRNNAFNIRVVRECLPSYT